MGGAYHVLEQIFCTVVKSGHSIGECTAPLVKDFVVNLSLDGIGC
jgi:hypothetical protein